MRVLLDTHALLWWWTSDSRLSMPARAAIEDETNSVLVSAASAWEIATKQRLGKLPDAPATERFAELMRADGFTPLPITQQHALRAGAYALAHRDPFDRMLAAQSQLEGVPLVSCDPALLPFGCALLW